MQPSPTPTTGAPSTEDTRRPRHLGRRLTIAVLAAGLALAGCTPTNGSTPTTPVETTVADPRTVLDQLADDLRQRIDALIAPIEITDRQLTGDGESVCDLPNPDEWPRQADYSWTLILPQADTRPLARQLADQLKAQGWMVRDYSAGPDQARLTAQHDGSAISIGGDNSSSGIAIVGDTACVRADGTVDTSPLP